MFAVKGSFFDSPTSEALRVRKGYIVVDNGKIVDFFNDLPSEYSGIELHDFSGRLIVPGMSDLHLHASQYRYCGTAMDVALIEWLSSYAYPEEARFGEPAYAQKMYSVFTQDILRSATTRACIFATIHTDATLELMSQLEKSGIISYVGKLNIDRNSPEYYRESSPEAGAAETERWILACREAGFKRSHPMITPRFTPSVTDKYMELIGKLAEKYSLTAQSHLSENTDEIEWVKELCPDTDFYAQSYSRYGLFGGNVPTVMAHCIYSGDEELELIRKNGVYIAHCPTSNENVIAGICPAAKYLRGGYNIGLGSDVSGGHTLNMFSVIASAVQVSKIYWKYIDASQKPLSIPEAFYMATVGGGSFFGKVGLFEPGYEFDAAVFSDDTLSLPIPLAEEERIERYCYRGSGIADAKYVCGTRLF